MTRLSAEINIEGTICEISDNLINIQFSGQDRSDPTLPSWGIKSNSGSLEMYDTDESIKKASEQGLLANSPVNIYLNVGDRKEQLGGFYVVGANQDKQTHKTTIEFQDALMSWQQKQMPKYYNFDATKVANINNIISSITSLNVSDGNTGSRILSLFINYPQIKEGSLWSQMGKICELGSFYIYCDEYGIPTIHYSGDT